MGHMHLPSCLAPLPARSSFYLNYATIWERPSILVERVEIDGGMFTVSTAICFEELEKLTCSVFPALHHLSVKINRNKYIELVLSAEPLESI